MLDNPKFHSLVFKVNVFFVISNAFFMMVLDDPTLNFVCALMSLCGAMSSYIVLKRLEDKYDEE